MNKLCLWKGHGATVKVQDWLDGRGRGATEKVQYRLPLGVTGVSAADGGGVQDHRRNNEEATDHLARSEQKEAGYLYRSPLGVSGRCNDSWHQ